MSDNPPSGNSTLKKPPITMPKHSHRGQLELVDSDSSLEIIIVRDPVAAIEVKAVCGIVDFPHGCLILGRDPERCPYPIPTGRMDGGPKAARLDPLDESWCRSVPERHPCEVKAEREGVKIFKRQCHGQILQLNRSPLLRCVYYTR